MDFSGNSVQPLGKIVTNKIVLERSNICVKQRVNGITVISGLWFQMNKVLWISEMVKVRWWPVVLVKLIQNHP